jgi:hypothetical protein
MAGDESFLVEDFLQAITSQLDRTQDALAVKAVTRPLTYALREFSMELRVFVEMDEEGSVRFRNSGPNEEGASSIQLAFTTITRPMIAENTISLAVTRSPNLEELGLVPQERRRLEQLGVRNAAQLQRLGSSAGTAAISRLSGVSLDRLRSALQMSQPRVTNVAPVGAKPGAEQEATQPGPVRNGGTNGSGGRLPPILGVREVPDRRLPNASLPGSAVRDEAILRPSTRLPETVAPRPEAVVGRLPISPDATRLRLTGTNLIGEDGPPAVRLNRRPLTISQADESELVVDLGSRPENGRLEIELSSGEVLAYDLSVEGEPVVDTLADEYGDDPWTPGGQDE